MSLYVVAEPTSVGSTSFTVETTKEKVHIYLLPGLKPRFEQHQSQLSSLGTNIPRDWGPREGHPTCHR